jgi:PII interaction protein X
MKTKRCLLHCTPNAYLGTDAKGIKFQSIGRTEARMMLENRLRTLRRAGHSQEYDQLQGVFQRTFQ